MENGKCNGKVIALLNRYVILNQFRKIHKVNLSGGKTFEFFICLFSVANLFSFSPARFNSQLLPDNPSIHPFIYLSNSRPILRLKRSGVCQSFHVQTHRFRPYHIKNVLAIILGEKRQVHSTVS